MHGGHWSVMREVKDLSSSVSECHGKESGAMMESLMNHTYRKDKEQTERCAVHCDAEASRMV